MFSPGRECTLQRGWVDDIQCESEGDSIWKRIEKVFWVLLKFWVSPTCLAAASFSLVRYGKKFRHELWATLLLFMDAREREREKSKLKSPTLCWKLSSSIPSIASTLCLCEFLGWCWEFTIWPHPARLPSLSTCCIFNTHSSLSCFLPG